MQPRQRTLAWRRTLAGLAVLLLGITGAHPAYADPPCDAAAQADFPVAGAPPIVTILRGAEAQKWTPPSWTRWSPPSKLVVALKGSFPFKGSMDDVLARVGAISALSGTRYWSVTDKKWDLLAHDAAALRAPDPGSRRADFSGQELTKGAQLYYWVDDTRSGNITYRLTVQDRAADHAAIVTENITPVRKYLITLFKPGALQSALFIQRLGPDTFGLTILSRTGPGASLFAMGYEASYVNRANALFRQIAGIKTDLEPPAAR